MSKEINVYFILPSRCEDELSTSDEMQQAFELCRQNQMTPEWVYEASCDSLNCSKKDIMVFEKFEGEAFKKIQSLKCLSIVGPWCIITCLIEGLQVPNNKSPVFNMAMYKLTVTASNYTPEQKKALKEQIEMMGGVFSLHITSSVTHLVTNSVRTQKYMVANEKGIAVMLDSWVADVWAGSAGRSVKATDAEFTERHRCPPFQGLRICCTGFDAAERTRLQRVIEQAGGTYSAKLATASVDVLICNPGIKSAKYDAAKKAKLPCVRVEWAYDSAEKGHALPEQNYVINMSSSTPTKSDAPLNPDFSMMSEIAGNETQQHDALKTSVSDTMCASLFNIGTPQTANKRAAQKENKMPDAIDDIDLKQVKQAGAFLDGCGVYLAGFSPERREKLCRILKMSGATRYDDISDRVTQVIVGDPNAHETKLLNSKGCTVPTVSTGWLAECLKQRQPVFEEPFAVAVAAARDLMPAPSSPLSKKGITLLQHDLSAIEPPPAPATCAEPPAYRDESMRMYLPTNKPDTRAQLDHHDDDVSQRNNETSCSEQEATWRPIFSGKTFKLLGYSAEEAEKMTSVVEELEGRVVGTAYRGITDYAVVPAVSPQVRHTATDTLNDLWLLECHSRNELLEPQYYHQPFYAAGEARPLDDCVITISGYTSFERSYIIQLIQHLGAAYQDKFARVTLPDQSVRASTHLICLEAAGPKHAAALRWGRPVVSHRWVLQCAATGRRPDETDFQLGAASNKRDSDGKKISPVQDKNELSSADGNENESAEKKCKLVKEAKRSPAQSPFKGFTSVASKSVPDEDASLLDLGAASEAAAAVVAEAEAAARVSGSEGEDIPITLEDGRVVGLNRFMQELRDQGLFDTPPPPSTFQTGTPVPEFLARMRREGRLPARGGTPARRDSEAAPSQGTPVGRYLRGLQERNVLPPGSPRGPAAAGTPDSPAPRPFYDVKTPDTPLGRFLGEDEPSRETRKHWQRYIDTFPHYKCHDRPPVQRRPSTPWSEVKKQAWAWLLRDKTAKPDASGEASMSGDADQVEDATVAVADGNPAVEETASQREVSNQLGQLQDMLRRRDSSGASRSGLLRLDGATPQKLQFEQQPPPPSRHEPKDSQTDTVGWDEPMETIDTQEETSADVSKTFCLRKFMLSALEQSVRGSCCSTIKSLGGEVSDLNQYDASATHVVCSNPTRNEKILSSMAAGKWIVHASYVQRSGEAGRFLDEELFEFGNPKSATNLSGVVEATPTVNAMHWWRLRSLETGHGAFHGMRALVFAKNKPPITRLIEAGSGMLVNANPPFDQELDVTHCFIDAKLKLDMSNFKPLAQKGVFCLNLLYLSSYLNSRTSVGIHDFIPTELREYYK